MFDIGTHQLSRTPECCTSIIAPKLQPVITVTVHAKSWKQNQSQIEESSNATGKEAMIK